MPPAASEPLVGRVLDGKYEILERIGAGGMGTVYRALHLTLGAPRAAKVMRPELAEDPDFVERFQREARMVESLRHPHLVSLYDFGQLTDGTWYMVSELVEGETLGALLRRGTLEPAEVARLLGQVADALAYAHRRGIVHRDISPDNVMITRGEGGERVAKLLDFGVAKRMGTATGEGTASSLLFGKIGYASPEQMGLLARIQDLDARSDVFSLSAVALEALAGRLPWRKDTLQAYVHDLLVRPEEETEKAVWALAPPAWRDALRGGLARHRERRVADIEILKRRMQDAAAGGGRAPAARKAGMWMALALAAAGAVSAPFWLGRPSPSAPPRESAAPAPLPSAAPTGTPPATIAEASAPPSPAAVRRESPPAPRIVPPPTAEPLAPPPPPAPASLVVDAVPPAQVVLDGARQGRTPATLASIAAGEHLLVLTTDDGRVYQERVRLQPGESLERRHRFPGFGSLAVTSDSWVEVSVDGAPPQQTPCRIDRLLAGTHSVRASRPGFQEKTLTVEVKEGETAPLRVVLERVP